MQHLAKDEVAKRMFRQTICQDCQQRPPESEKLPASVARSCEANCPVFLNIDGLRQVSACGTGPTVATYEAAIRARICNQRCSQQGHGDYCGKATNATCPLVRFLGEVL